MLVHNFVTQHQIFSVGAAEIFLGANQLSSETVGAAPKTQWRTSGAAKAWIPHWLIIHCPYIDLILYVFNDQSY